MSAVFTQIHLFRGINRMGERLQTITAEGKTRGDKFMVRYHPEGNEFYVDYGDASWTLHNAQILGMSENEIEVSGFRRVYSGGWEPLTIVLTRPGTGWDGKDPVDVDQEAKV